MNHTSTLLSLLLITMIVICGCSSTPSSGIYGWSVYNTDRYRPLVRRELVRQAIMNGEGLSSKDIHRDTPLLWAARVNDIDLVKWLLNNHDFDINQGNEVTGETPLIYAAKNGSIDLVRFLLSQGADSTLRDHAGNTAADWAIQAKHLQIADVIVSSDSHYPANIGELDLVSAVYSKDPSIVSDLITKGAAVNKPNAKGETPFLAAVKIGDPNIIQILLNNGADITQQDSNGRNGLILASQAGHLIAVDQLLKSGLAIDSSDNYKNTSLIYAAANGKAAVVDFLLQRGAAVDLINTDSKSALFIAAENKQWYIAELLLIAGSSPFLISDDLKKQQPDTSAALFVLSGDYYLSNDSKNKAIKAYEGAVYYFHEEAELYNSKAFNESINIVKSIVTEVLFSTAISVAQQEHARTQAKQQAQLSALGSSSTLNEYYTNVSVMTPIYTRAALVESQQNSTQYNNWIYNEVSAENDTSRHDRYELIASMANSEAEKLEQFIKCIKSKEKDELTKCKTHNSYSH